MAITLSCGCGQTFTVRDELAGLTGKCPVCGNPLTVPVSPADTLIAVLTGEVVEAVRRHWPGSRIDLCVVKLPSPTDVQPVMDALISEAQGADGPAQRDLMVVGGTGRERGADFAFAGVIGRQTRKMLLPWFCQCIIDLLHAHDAYLVFALDHAVDDMLRPDGGAIQVAIHRYQWVQESLIQEEGSTVLGIKSLLDNEARLPSAQSSSAGMILDPLTRPLGDSGVYKSPARSRVKEADSLARAEEEDALLRQLRTARTVAQVMPSLQSPNPNMRTAAIEKLTALRDPGGIGLLVHALNDEHLLVRRKAVEALGDLGDSRAIEMLAVRLDDEAEDPKIREEAVWSMAKIRHPDALRRAAPILVRWAKENSYRTPQAVEFLSQMKVPGVVQLLVRQLPEDFESESGTLRALRGIGPPHIVKPLIDALNNPDYLARTLVAELLGETKDGAAVEPLMALMEEDDKQLRKTAIEALAKIGDMRAASAFQEAAHDKSKSVRKAATEALQAMGITWI